MEREILKAFKSQTDTINDLVRRVDNLAHDHYRENADQITDMQEIIVEGLYEDTLNEFLGDEDLGD